MLGDDAAVARRGAEHIAGCARAAAEARGRFAFAVSGGHTPWAMLAELAAQDLPWARLELFQVDERIAPAGDPDRNWTHLAQSLLARISLDPARLHPMPVEDADLEAAAARYAATLHRVTGSPAVLDLVHLGLGPDGHTASLVPGDHALAEVDADVALAGPYQGRRRMTLTYPALDRARSVLWLVTGDDKREMLARLLRGDRSIPAGRVRQDAALVLADRAAAGERSSRRAG